MLTVRGWGSAKKAAYLFSVGHLRYISKVGAKYINFLGAYRQSVIFVPVLVSSHKGLRKFVIYTF